MITERTAGIASLFSGHDMTSRAFALADGHLYRIDRQPSREHGWTYVLLQRADPPIPSVASRGYLRLSEWTLQTPPITLAGMQAVLDARNGYRPGEA